MTESQKSDEELAEVIRAEILHLTESRQTILEKHSHSFKWLTASLLAINGAAGAATINSAISPIWKVAAGSAFSFGVILALLVAVLAQKVSMKSLPPIQRQIGYWIGVIHDGTRLEDFESTLTGEMKEATKWGWTIPVAGWVSGLFFAAGLAMTAMGILSVSEESICGKGVSVSRDHPVGGNDCGHSPLSSPHPRRPDDADAASPEPSIRSGRVGG